MCTGALRYTRPRGATRIAPGVCEENVFVVLDKAGAARVVVGTRERRVRWGGEGGGM